MSYGYNYQYLARDAGRGGNGASHEAQIEFPAETIAIADSWGTGGWATNPLPWSDADTNCDRWGNHGYTIDPPLLPPSPGNSFGTSCTPSSTLPGYPDPGHTRVAARHSGGANVAFCDGHARWMRREVLEKDNTYWNGRKDPNP